MKTLPHQSKKFTVDFKISERSAQEAELLQKFLTLDLVAVNSRASRKLGWSPSKVKRIEYLYRRFLFLCCKYPGRIAPSDDIDAFWELHILDTKQYFKDCTRIFGFFLHHNPNFLRDNPITTKEDLYMMLAETKILFELEFGEGMAEEVMSGCPECIPDYDPPHDPDPDVTKWAEASNI